MTQSDATSVQEYIESVDEDWRPIVLRIREICLERLVGCDEVMAYGMPTYQESGRVTIGFARQKRYLSLYVSKQGVLDEHRRSLLGVSLGKGCVRFTRPQQVDFAVIEELIEASARSQEPPC